MIEVVCVCTNTNILPNTTLQNAHSAEKLKSIHILENIYQVLKESGFPLQVKFVICMNSECIRDNMNMYVVNCLWSDAKVTPNSHLQILFFFVLNCCSSSRYLTTSSRSSGSFSLKNMSSGYEMVGHISVMKLRYFVSPKLHWIMLGHHKAQFFSWFLLTCRVLSTVNLCEITALFLIFLEKNKHQKLPRLCQPMAKF